MKKTNDFKQAPLTAQEIKRGQEIAASLPKIDHPETYPHSARDLYDQLLTLKYNEDGKWRVQVELADRSKAIIAVNNRQEGELARAQIRGIALELLGHYLVRKDVLVEGCTQHNFNQLMSGQTLMNVQMPNPNCSAQNAGKS